METEMGTGRAMEMETSSNQCGKREDEVVDAAGAGVVDDFLGGLSW